ncbi:MAG: ABC transporter permease [Alphaproteobacteria bacterium]|nr:ABC transporter permease [Alphaproteobacteria bacterium]
MVQNIRKPTLFTIGLLLVLFWILVAIFAGILAPYHPDARFINLARANSVNFDGGVFIFGTDLLGRDILSRLLIAARNMIVMTSFASLIAFAIGLICGTIAGYYRGFADRLLKLVSRVLLALPIIGLLILAHYHYGLSEFYSVVVASLVVVPSIFKHVRALVIKIKKRDFISVAIMRGEKPLYIIGREIFPNIMQPLFADFLMRCSQIVIVIALIGFLGLGASSGADWGSMVREGQEYIAVMGYYLFIPCIAIASLVLGLNLMAMAIQCDDIESNIGK